MDKMAGKWLRYLLYTFGTRLRFLGDSGSGICFPLEELASILPTSNAFGLARHMMSEGTMKGGNERL
jgi:hypothetical protein